MNYLKRAIYSIKQKLIKNILITLIFSVIFTVTIGAIVIYTTSNDKLEYMKKNIGNSVTLMAPFFTERYTNRLIGTMVSDETVEKFIDSEYADSYNYASYALVKFTNIKPIYMEEREKNIMYWGGEDVTAYMPVDSSGDIAFTIGGYHLVNGRHFTIEDENKNVCIISEQLAEENGLKLGDTFRIENINPRRLEYKPEVEIIGIFSAPESDYMKGIAYRPEEIIFMPYNMSNGEISSPEDKNNVSWVSVFLKDIKDLEAFIEETKEKFNILNVYESHFDKNHKASPPEMDDLEGLDLFEMGDYFYENPIYNIEIDREWYEMVAKPIEKVNTLAGMMTIAMIVSAVIILSLISILSLKGRKKEFGVLLSIGESRAKVVGQIMLETMLPVLIASLIGIGMGMLTGIPLVEGLSNDVYSQNAVQQQGVNDVTTYAHISQNNVSREILAGAAFIDLIFRLSYNVIVAPQPLIEINKVSIIAYILLSVALVFISIVIQMVSVLRIKPARILTGKG